MRNQPAVRFGRRWFVALLLLVATATPVGCSRGRGASAGTGTTPSAGMTARSTTSTPTTTSYTDPGDGCAQIVSAISYADDVLKPLGQEDYQVFDDAVRSRLYAVEGTIEVESDDLPFADVLAEGRTLQRLALAAAAGEKPTHAQITALRTYRREAAQMVLLCTAAAQATPESVRR